MQGKDLGFAMFGKKSEWDPFFPLNFQAILNKYFEMNPIHLATHLAYFV
jgi:hypothetical protein